MKKRAGDSSILARDTFIYFDCFNKNENEKIH